MIQEVSVKSTISRVSQSFSSLFIRPRPHQQEVTQKHHPRCQRLAVLRKTAGIDHLDNLEKDVENPEETLKGGNSA